MFACLLVSMCAVMCTCVCVYLCIEFDALRVIDVEIYLCWFQWWVAWVWTLDQLKRLAKLSMVGTLASEAANQLGISHVTGFRLTPSMANGIVMLRIIKLDWALARVRSGQPVLVLR